MEINCSYQKLVPIESLVSHPANANKHGDKQIEMLAKIMKYQGWRHPIVVSGLSGYIVAGHGRLDAAKKNGWTEVPIDTQEFEDKIQETAFLWADNKISELAEHDDEIMKAGALELGLDNGFDLDLLGVLDLDLSFIDPDKDVIEDEVPDVTQSISKLGDLYELGEHRLLCGDSTDKATVELLMNGAKADMVFTDPPYGMGLDTDYSKMGSTGLKHKAGLVDEFKPELIQAILDINCGETFIFGADYFAEHLPNRNDGSFIVWDKRSDKSNIALLDGQFGSSFELCWSRTKHKRDICRELGARGFYESDKNEKQVHPTQKPTRVIEWFFGKWGKDKTNIIDLFGGSGSTLIACEKTKRKCYMMELDPHYCDVIVSRYCKYTGKTEIKRNGEPMNWTV